MNTSSNNNSSINTLQNQNNRLLAPQGVMNRFNDRRLQPRGSEESKSQAPNQNNSFNPSEISGLTSNMQSRRPSHPTNNIALNNNITSAYLAIMNQPSLNIDPSHDSRRQANSLIPTRTVDGFGSASPGQGSRTINQSENGQNGDEFRQNSLNNNLANIAGQIGTGTLEGDPGGEHDNKLQQLINKFKKNKEQDKDIERIEKEINKKIVKRKLTKDDIEMVVFKKKIVVVKRAFFFLDARWKFRKFFIYLVEWIWFERCVMVLIFCNSIFLAAYDYGDRSDSSMRNYVINIGGRVFTAFFTIEMVSKILAYGFVFHRKAYMRNGWNWLDFIVVIFGWIEIIPQIPNFRGIRTFRVLRPLRAINSIENLKNQVESLIKSLGQLVNVLLFLLFLFLIFGILGIQIYSGQFYQRCRMTEFPDEFGFWPVDTSIDRLCSLQNETGWYKCPAGRYCGAPQDYGLSLERENLTLASYMNYGFTTFDNIGASMLTIFQVITLEGWSDLMYMMMDSNSPILAGFFFIILVFLGAFFLLNVILVVIISNYSETKNQAKQREQNFETRLNTISSMTQMNDSKLILFNASPCNSDAPPIILLNDRHNQSDSIVKEDYAGQYSKWNPISGSILSESIAGMNSTPYEGNNQGGRSQTIKQISEQLNNLNSSPCMRKSSLPVIDRPRNSTPIIDLDEVVSGQAANKIIQEEMDFEDHNVNGSMNVKMGGFSGQLEIIAEVKSPRKEGSNINSKFISPRKHHNQDDPRQAQQLNKDSSTTHKDKQEDQQLKIETLREQGFENQSDIENNDEKGNRCQRCVYAFQNFFLYICMSKIFAVLVLLLITMNTVILALDQYPLDKKRDQIYDQINTFLTWFFFVEMLVKIIGLGVTHYVRDKVNIFDALIVLLTVAENITDIVLTSQGKAQQGAISGFRAIRLFRFFKVARTMKSFQIMIEKISISLDDILSFSVLLFLFLFTFTLLGLEIFSNQVKFNAIGYVDLENGSSSRPNFDDFIQGFVTIFMVLIGDNWPQYMYKHMIATGTPAAFFFVALQIFGKYVLLNLFLAILLENFEEIEVSQKNETQISEDSGSQSNKSRAGPPNKLVQLWEWAKRTSLRCIKRGQVKVLPIHGTGMKSQQTSRSNKLQTLNEQNFQFENDSNKSSKALLGENQNRGTEGGELKNIDSNQHLNTDGQIDQADLNPNINDKQRMQAASGLEILIDAAIGSYASKEQILKERRDNLNSNHKSSQIADITSPKGILSNKSPFNPDESQKLALLKQKSFASAGIQSPSTNRFGKTFFPDDRLNNIIVGEGNIDISSPQYRRELTKKVTLRKNMNIRGIIGEEDLNEDLPDKMPEEFTVRDNNNDNLANNESNQRLQEQEAPNTERKAENQALITQKTGRRKPQNFMETVIYPQQNRENQNHQVQLHGWSLYIMGPHNCFRQFISKIVHHRIFDPFIILIIIFSTVLMAIDNPLNDPNGTLSIVLNQIDIVITGIFALESLLKIICYGLIFNKKHSYLRVSWNVMDFVIVIFSIISIIFNDMNIQFIKVVRMLRVLRPLRMISRNEGLKIAVISLINAIPSIINALVIALLFFLLFAIFGTTYFKGKFFYCLTDNINQLVNVDAIDSKWDCLNSGGDWVNQIINFDNVIKSMAALFILSSTEGWGDIMFQGVDATDIDYNPKQNNQIAWAFFFMLFMIVGSLFMLNLFVSIVVNTYYGEKEKLYRNDLLTKFQKIWLQIQTICLQEEPEKQITVSANRFQRLCQYLAADNSWFDYFILVCIIANTIIMAINWYGIPQKLSDSLEYTNYFFMIVFTVEAVIKIVAQGVRGYFTQGWNIFDFIIVFISYVTLIIGFAAVKDIGPKQTTIARAFRIGRIFRLITKAKFLRVIFNTIIFTIPSLANVGALMMLLLFIFSILGVQIFATVKLQTTLNEHANFQNFGIALLTLIRLQTGEGWNEMMKDLATSQNVNFDCNDNPTYESIQLNGGNPDGCGSSFSYLFFVLFQLIVSIIFLNLFVAVILNGFTNSNEEEGFEIFKTNIAKFKKVWRKYDPEATGFINIDELKSLILDLEKDTEIITISLSENSKALRNFIAHMQVPTYLSFTKYYFQDILTVISKKYICHQYVIEYLKTMEIQDNKDQVTVEKNIRERQFEEEIVDIQRKGETEKIQLIEENLRHTIKYKNRMYGHVDKFEDNIYDSSYVIWVPYIQQRLRPVLMRFKERRIQAAEQEEAKRQFIEEVDHMDQSIERNERVLSHQTNNNHLGGDLIIETGSQLVSNLNQRSTNHRRNHELGQNVGNTLFDGARNFPSANSGSFNDEEIIIMGKNNIRGQTTGEVGGTLYLGDDQVENSRVEAGAGGIYSRFNFNPPEQPSALSSQFRSARHP